MPKATVVVELFTVVGGEGNHRVLIEPKGAELVEKETEILV